MYVNKLEKLKKLTEIKRIARVPSEGFSYVRVDIYNNEKIIFGELTFFHESGYKTFLTKSLKDKWEINLFSQNHTIQFKTS